MRNECNIILLFLFFPYLSASECIFNMDMSDLDGRTIKVSLAQQNQLSKLAASQSGKSGQEAIWSSDAWFQQHVVGGSEEEQKKAEEAKQDRDALKD